MSDTYPNKAFDEFYDNEQIRNYLLQFMAIFSGMKVSVGKNSFESEDGGLVFVPVRYGSTDRVVEWIISSQTKNKPLRLPVMAVKINGIELSPELRKGMRTESSKTVLPRGGNLPEDLKVIRQMNPNPAKVNMQLSVLSSNLKNRFQILEQILVLFDPDVQIFTSDDYQDKYKISRVELMDISFDEDYPMGNNKNIIVDNYQFVVNGYFRAPIDLKENFVKSIRLRLDAISGLSTTDAVIELNNIGNSGDVLFDMDDLNMPDN